LFSNRFPPANPKAKWSNRFWCFYKWHVKLLFNDFQLTYCRRIQLSRQSRFFSFFFCFFFLLWLHSEFTSNILNTQVSIFCCHWLELSSESLERSFECKEVEVKDCWRFFFFANCTDTFSNRTHFSQFKFLNFKSTFIIFIIKFDGF